MADRFCSVSVDLDPLRCYYSIHGIGEPPEPLADVVLRRSLPRFAEVLARRGIRATLFVVGSDLAAPGPGRALLGEAARAGHELASHSYSHPYDMARLDRARVDDELDRAHALIAEVAGAPPCGFRAPGYDISPIMLDALMARGYRYDSSVFPAPAYWTLKLAIMGILAAAGRPSGAVVGNPRALLAPTRPYRPDPRSPWRRGQASIVELPVSVSPRFRIPAIGTNLLLAPTPLRARLLESLRGEPFFNFELHGVDLIDADEDGIPAAIVAREPALRAPLLVKRRALEATLDRLALDYTFAPLRDVAARVQRLGELPTPGA